MAEKRFKLVVFFWSCVLVLSAQTDQTLQWASYFGGDDLFDPLTVTYPTQLLPSPDGGMLACGWTDSPSGLVVPPAHQAAMLGNAAGFFVKIDAERNIEYASYFGGEDEDIVTDMALLTDGGFVLVGSTSSFQEIATPQSFIESKPEGACGFIARFNDAGQLQWSTYLGGDSPLMSVGTVVSSVIIDQNDNIFCVGHTESTSFPIIGNAHQTIHGGDSDGFIARFSPEGIPVFSTYIGGNQDDRISAVRFADDGNLIVGGATSSNSQIASSGSYQQELGGNSDAFLLKMTTNGEVLWGTYFGGSGNDGINGIQSIELDGDGNIYTLLNTESSGMQLAGPSFEELNYPEVVLVAQFTPQGLLSWSRYLDYWPLISPKGMRYCGDNLVVFGTASPGISNISMGNPYQPEVNASANNGDMFLQGISQGGELLWGTYYGGTSNDTPRSLNCFGPNQLLLSGSTRSNGIAITPDAFQPEKSSWVNALFAIFEVPLLTDVPAYEELRLRVFPNPATDHIWLELPLEFSFNADVTVHSLSGQVLYRHPHFNAQQPLSLPSTPGVYIVTARNGNATARTRVMVY